KAWATWGAFGPVAVTKEGLLFVPEKAESDGGSILDLSLPAFLKPSTDEKSSGPFFVYRGKSMPWLAGNVLFAGDDGDNLPPPTFQGRKDGSLACSEKP
ncbi:MAG: hypothetical protein ACK43N_08215, partial [Pirellulaceae bacterium]